MKVTPKLLVLEAAAAAEVTVVAEVAVEVGRIPVGAVEAALARDRTPPAMVMVVVGLTLAHQIDTTTILVHRHPLRPVVVGVVDPVRNIR